MTLSAHLHGGALGAWFRAWPADTAVVTDRIADALRGRVPLRSPRHSARGHGALVQSTLRARLGLVVQHAPPYRALAGSYRRGLASATELHALAARFPSHALLDAGRRGAALRWRPVADGWLDAGDPFAVVRASSGRHDGRVLGVVATQLSLLDQWAPPGRLGAADCEHDLAFQCAVTVSWIAGMPTVPPAGTPLSTTGARLPISSAADEAAELAVLACEAGLLTRLHRWAGRPGLGVALGVADAVFVPGWAAGGTVVGGGGTRSGPTLLLDVVTTPDPLRRPERLAAWWHHLLARAWLDTPDRHGVTHVGIYFARHGALVTWRVDEFAGCGHDEVGGAPPGFLERARLAAMADGVELGAGGDRWRSRAEGSSADADNILCTP